MNDNYVAYHVHTELSLLDSCTNFKQYINKAKKLGQKAISFTEHGNIYSWVEKKMYCDSKERTICNECKHDTDELVDLCPKCKSKNIEQYIGSIKYLHAIEIYLTKTHNEKERDNFHSILIAKNYDGVKEINQLIELSSREDHKYYNDRISFDEFFSLSNNVIKISACMASPLNNISENDPIFEKLITSYDYLEVQPHVNSTEQIEYNKKLLRLSHKYNIPLIAGTDTHSIDKYKAECREILLKAKRKLYNNEDEFDLTYKNYTELVDMFERQGALSQEEYLKAIENTNVMADSVDNFQLDISFKYPKLYENEEDVFWDRIIRMYNEKLENGVIKENSRYMNDINEEFAIFKKIGMCSFMLFMSELMCWCWESNIPSSPCRGSVGGSTIAYITDITDVDPIIWGTVFSRFANEDRIEIGDVDVDFAPNDREKVYQYIVERFGEQYTSYIMTTGTCVEKGTIDEICRALDIPLNVAEKIKAEYSANPENTKTKYPNVFYYFDGLLNTVVSKGIHPAAMIISPITLADNYGVYHYDGKCVISINMEEVHEVSLVKYDILGLKNVGVIKTCCEFSGIPYPKSHTINWNDNNVWDDICKSNIGIFQFESGYAGDCLKKFEPRKINDMSLVNAAIRPSGTSYRDRLFAKIVHKNPSKIIDEMLSDNYGYLVFQEDTIKFLKDICGLLGSEADNVRRAIGRKQRDRLEKALPQIMEGYCSKSSSKREIAEKEAKTFLQIIEDSSDYQFGYNHSTGYSMLGYLCAYMRYYYPLEFCTALLINAKTEDDTVDGTELARLLKVKISPIKFRYSKAEYTPDKENNAIYKGIGSVKFCNVPMGDDLYLVRDKKYTYFIDLLIELSEMSINSRQLDILTKLDFFSEFGNSKELLRIIDIFNLFKQGSAKQISKDKVSGGIMSEIISRYSRQTDKKYILNDVISCMRECEQYIKNVGIEDFTIKEKASTQLEYLGYVDVRTNDESERNNLFVLGVEKLKTKDKTKVWAYKIKTLSIGSGKQAELTVYSRDFDKNPINKFDTIKVKKECLQKKEYNGYTNWYLSNYQIIA